MPKKSESLTHSMIILLCHLLPITYSVRYFLTTIQINRSRGEERSNQSTDMDYQGRQLLAWNQMVYMNALIREKLEDEGLSSTYPTDYNSSIYKLQSEIW